MTIQILLMMHTRLRTTCRRKVATCTLPMAIVALLSLACGEQPNEDVAPYDASGPDATDSGSVGDVDGRVENDSGDTQMDWTSRPERPDSATLLHPSFDLDDEGFYSTPWPADFRLDGDGHVDLSDFPNPSNALVSRYIQTAEESVRGYSTSPVIYVGFDELPSEASLPSVQQTLHPASAVQLLELNDGCGRRIPIEISFIVNGDTFVEDNTLAVTPASGFVLNGETAYGLVVLESFGAEDGYWTDRPVDFDAVFSDDSDDNVPASYQPLRDCLSTFALEADEIAVGTVFSTQNPIEELARIRDWVVDPEVLSPPVVFEIELSERAGLVELRGVYETPIFQRGEPPYALEGGGFEFGTDSAPVIQRWEEVGFLVTYPSEAVNPPVAIVIGGTGFELGQHINDEFREAMFRAGYALASFEPQFHGSRATASDDVNIHSFNYFNPESARSVLRQQVVDTAIFVRLLRESLEDIDGLAQLDTNTLVYVGHSQGALVGAIAAGVETEISAYLLNGAGGHLTTTLVERTEPVNLNQLIQAFVGLERPLDRYHPLFALIQLSADATDPLNYAPRWRGCTTYPSGSNLFLINGQLDTWTPQRTGNALIIAGDVTPIDPPGWDVDPHELWDIAPLAIPIVGNTVGLDAGELTIAAFLDADRGHYTLHENATVRRLAEEFLRTAQLGVPRLDIVCEGDGVLSAWEDIDGVWSGFGRLGGIDGSDDGIYDRSPCTSAYAGEALFPFVAPSAGDYLAFLRTAYSSRMDLSITVHEGCWGDGEVIDCAANGGDSMISLGAGQHVVIRVDGDGVTTNGTDFELVIVEANVTAGGACEFELDVCERGLICRDGTCEPSCPTASLNDLIIGEERYGEISVLPMSWGRDSGQFVPPIPYSGSGSGPEVTYNFVAPSTGLFRFSLDFPETNPDVVLYFLESCDPESAVIAFEWGSGPEFGGPLFELALAEGEEVVVVVDAGSFLQTSRKPYRIEVTETQLSETGGFCDGASLVCVDDGICINNTCRPQCPSILLNEHTIGSNRFGFDDVIPGYYGVSSGSMEHPDLCEPDDGGGGERTFLFVVPETGTYIFTVDSEFGTSTALYLLEGCGPDDSALACSSRGRRQIEIELESGREVVVVVDAQGAYDNGEPYRLTAGLVMESGLGEVCDFTYTLCSEEAPICTDETCHLECPTLDLNEFEEGDQYTWRDTRYLPGTGGSTVVPAGCGERLSDGTDGAEISYHFEAPFEGVYRFTTASSDTDEGVAVIAKSHCGDESILACDWREDGAIVDVALAAGEIVTIVVDATTSYNNFSTYDLRAGLLQDAELGQWCDSYSTLCQEGLICVNATCAPTCGSIDLNALEVEPNVFHDTGLIPGLYRHASGVFSAPVDCDPDSTDEAGEVTYHFTAPETGRYELTTFLDGTEARIVLYLLEDCGQEDQNTLACQRSEGYYVLRDGPFQVDLAASQEVVLVVDGFSRYDNEEPYELRVMLLQDAQVGDACSLGQDRCQEGLICTSDHCQTQCPSFDLGQYEIGEHRWAHVGTLPLSMTLAQDTRCSPDVDPLLTFRFEAPATGTFLFHGFTSVGAVDLLLMESCDAAEPLQCAEHTWGNRESLLYQDMEAGEEVIVGFDVEESSAFGQPYQLFVSLLGQPALGEACDELTAPCEESQTCLEGICRSECPNFNLNDYPNTLLDNAWNATGAFPFDSSPVFLHDDEVTFSFNAPNNGSYVFSNDSFDTTGADAEILLCASCDRLSCAEGVTVEMVADESIVVQLTQYWSPAYGLYATRVAADRCDESVNRCEPGFGCDLGRCVTWGNEPELNEVRVRYTQNPQARLIEIMGRAPDRNIVVVDVREYVEDGGGLSYLVGFSTLPVESVEYDINGVFDITLLGRAFHPEATRFSVDLVSATGRRSYARSADIEAPIVQGQPCPIFDAPVCQFPSICLADDFGEMGTCVVAPDSDPPVLELVEVIDVYLDGANESCNDRYERNGAEFRLVGSNGAAISQVRWSYGYMTASETVSLDGSPEFDVRLRTCSPFPPVDTPASFQVLDETGNESEVFQLDL